MGDSLAREDVLPRLRGRLGREYRYVESTPSTQLLVETGRREIDRADLLVELLEQLERGYDAWVSGARG